VSRFWHGLLWIPLYLLLFGVTLWAVGALYFDLPIAGFRAPLAFIYLGAVLVAFIFVKGRWRAMGVVAFAFVVVLAWWLTIKPTGDRNWQPDVAQKAWADIQGDEVTVHNVRNFEYRSETDYTPRWERRTVQLSKLFRLARFLSAIRVDLHPCGRTRRHSSSHQLSPRTGLPLSRQDLTRTCAQDFSGVPEATQSVA